MSTPTSRFIVRMLLGACTLLAIPASASASWWNSDWTARKLVTIDTGASGAPIGDPIGSTPVLIRLHDGNFNFPAAKGDGTDLRFVAEDDKTLLPYHIEKFDSLLDVAFVWVRVPDLKPGAKTSFWMYYGNGSSSATKADDTKGTYDSDTLLVYHFGEHGQPAFDYSGQGNVSKIAGTAADGAMIGTGIHIDGNTPFELPDTQSLAWVEGEPLTWTAWIKPSSLAANAVIFSRSTAVSNEFAIGIDHGVPFVEVADQGRTLRTPAGAPLTINSWQHLAVVADGSKITLFIDGEPYGVINGALPTGRGSAHIGGSAGAGFSGDIDELEISKTVRPTGYIKFAAISQGGDRAQKLFTFGDEEAPKNWLSWISSGTVGILIRSLTIDGWVVIGILAIMAVISWSIMITKASYLNATSRGNSIFMKEWRHLSADLTAIDGADSERIKTMGGRINPATQRQMKTASVYRIYHIGAEEIRHRVTSEKGRGKGLSARSIQAIRASLDTGLVHESHKLNNQMVLLTIAISGGPFLGLLGTVVGVMITFAAIAAAGDVNVNAIAPGIAAALVATVAGLAVAIPALFGYNYLLARVKDATSDMHVFVDEFVTKMAEYYPEPKE